MKPPLQSNIITLITNPANPILTTPLAEAVCEVLSAADIDWLDFDWLNQDVACDITLANAGDSDPEMAAKIIRAILFEYPIDVVLQNAETRRKKALIADMDSTMIEQECIDELADIAGIKDQVAQITARAMNGEIEFEASLNERLGLLAGRYLAD